MCTTTVPRRHASALPSCITVWKSNSNHLQIQGGLESLRQVLQKQIDMIDVRLKVNYLWSLPRVCMDPVYSPYHTWAYAELWTLDGAYDGPDVRRRRLHGHGFNQASYRVTEFHRVHGFDAVDFTRTH